MVEPVVVELDTEFTCTTNGSFPDPESCHKYYVCNIMPDGGAGHRVHLHNQWLLP